MTQLTLNVTDESLIPMLRKLFRSIEGVEIAPRRRRKSGIELAYEDVEAGRVYYAKDGSDLIRQCLDEGIMYEVIFTNQFKHAVKRCAKRGLDVSKIAVVVDILRAKGSLPQEYYPHKLSGFKGNNTWECHIQPDWLLIWEQNDTQLTLLMLNTGTHSDLFGAFFLFCKE